MAYTTNYSFKRFDATGSIMYVVVNILNDAGTPAVVETIDSFPIKLPIDAAGAVLQGTNLDSHITTTLASVFDANYLQQRKYQYDNGNVVTNAHLIYTLTSEIEAGEQAPQVVGFIFDPSGTPINGVTVTSSNGQSATTDVSGGFIFAATGGLQKITASKSGYFSNFKMITVDGITNVNITLLVESGTGSSVSLTGLTSGAVTGTGTGRASNNAEVEFPVNAIVDGSNNPVASATMKIGNIVVSDTGAADVFPGYFLGDVSGSNDPIESYGYINVSVEDGSGNPLSLNPAIGAIVRIPVNPDPVGTNTINAWRLNETTGIWEQAGTATRVGATNVFEFTTTTFSWLNLDVPLTSTCSLTVTVYASKEGATPVTKAKGVDVTVGVGTSWGSRPTVWQGRGTTDSNGQVTMDVPPGYLSVRGKRGLTTFLGDSYGTSGTAGSCTAFIDLYPDTTDNPSTPSAPTLALTSPTTLVTNQAATISWVGGKASNTIKLQTLDPVTEQITTTTLLSNSILVSGSISFTPTLTGHLHQFFIEAVDFNGDTSTAYSPNTAVPS